jgi:hypothetical protein
VAGDGLQQLDVGTLRDQRGQGVVAQVMPADLGQLGGDQRGA